MTPNLSSARKRGRPSLNRNLTNSEPADEIIALGLPENRHGEGDKQSQDHRMTVGNQNCTFLQQDHPSKNVTIEIQVDSHPMMRQSRRGVTGRQFAARDRLLTRQEDTAGSRPVWNDIYEVFHFTDWIAPTIEACIYTWDPKIRLKGVAALDTIAGYTKDIPSCAFLSFKKAMVSEKCEVDNVDASSFDCLCRHLSAIAIAVSRHVDTQCSVDFAEAIGHVCGVWQIYGSTASELPEATSILDKDLSGDSSNKASNTATETKSGSGAAVAASSTSSDNGAAMPTGGSRLVTLGGIVALAGVLV
ncbi:hypothetical protein QWA68_016621 [Fusarium oxysporum]|nr:hypothetical protein QWA68_016621 [Fusarium oxysporum]